MELERPLEHSYRENPGVGGSKGVEHLLDVIGTAHTGQGEGTLCFWLEVNTHDVSEDQIQGLQILLRIFS